MAGPPVFADDEQVARIGVSVGQQKAQDNVTRAANTAIDRVYSKQLETAITNAAPNAPEGTRLKMQAAATENNHDDFVKQAKEIGMDAEALWTECLRIMQQKEARKEKVGQLLVDGYEHGDKKTTITSLTREGIPREIAAPLACEMHKLMGDQEADNAHRAESTYTKEKGWAPGQLRERDRAKVAAFAASDTAVAISQENSDVITPLDRETERRRLGDRMMNGLTEEQRKDLMNALAGLLDHGTLNYLGEKYQMQSLAREQMQNNCQTFLNEERNARNEKERERLYQEFAAKSGDQETAGRLYQYYKTENTEGRDEVIVAVLADHAVARWYLDNGYPDRVIPSRKSPTEIA